MSEQRPSDVLGALPQRRPHRRSAKRVAPAETSKRVAPAETSKRVTPAETPSVARPKSPRQRGQPARNPRATTQAAAPTPPSPPAPAPATARRRPPRLRQPAQPAGVPATPPSRPPDQPSDRHVLGTAAQAAAELAEIGLSVSARALRRVVDRLPRP